MSRPLLTVAVALAAFLLGAIPFSWIIGRLAGGVDLRTTGSGNAGATNLARSLGLGAGLLGLGLDAAKGVAAVLLARAAAFGPGVSWQEVLAGALVILGHNFTPFLRFRGGKGVATGAGVFGTLAPWAFVVALAVFGVVVALSRTVSLGSVLAAAALPLAVHLIYGERKVTLLAALVAVLVIARHRANLGRIAAGSESRLGAGRDR